MKLTEAQKQVLRTMLRYDCIIAADRPSSAGWYEKPRLPRIPQPAWNTLDCLYWKHHLLSREHDEIGFLVYRLTAKGHEVAKELEE